MEGENEPPHFPSPHAASPAGDQAAGPGSKPTFSAPLCEAGPDSANTDAPPGRCPLGSNPRTLQAGGGTAPRSCERVLAELLLWRHLQVLALSFVAPLAAPSKGLGPRALGPSLRTRDRSLAEQLPPQGQPSCSLGATRKLLSLSDSHPCPLFPGGLSSTSPLLPSW